MYPKEMQSVCLSHLHSMLLWHRHKLNTIQPFKVKSWHLWHKMELEVTMLSDASKGRKTLFSCGKKCLERRIWYPNLRITENRKWWIEFHWSVSSNCWTAVRVLSWHCVVEKLQIMYHIFHKSIITVRLYRNYFKGYSFIHNHLICYDLYYIYVLLQSPC